VRRTSFIALFSSACALTTNLQGLDDGGAKDAGDAAIDVSDADTKDVIDAAVEASDASADAKDAVAEAGPCVATPLAGTANLTGMKADNISSGSVDLIQFTATAGTARCAWIYVTSLPQNLSTVYLTVYDHDSNGNPTSLLATATLPNVIIGWNNAVLDSPLALTANQHVWIGALSPTDSLPIQDSTQCTGTLREDHPVAVPPQNFVQTGTFNTCNLAIYIGP
jgi:hypothetical protein